MNNISSYPILSQFFRKRVLHYQLVLILCHGCRIISSLNFSSTQPPLVGCRPPPQRSLVAYSPPPPPTSPLLEAVIAYRAGMEGESSATSGNRLNNRLTAAPPAAGVNTPNTCSITACLLELYQECVENGVWVRVLYKARNGTEKLTFLRKTSPPSSRPPGRRPASERRRARDKRRREAWAERRRTRSQTRPPANPLPSGCGGGEATAVAAPTTAVVGAAAAPAQAVDASSSPAASSTPTPTLPDPRVNV
jgi:hypothetical protein